MDLKNFYFHRTVIDEAGVDTDDNVLGATTKRCCNLVICGDPKQLPPTCDDVARKYGLDDPMYAKLCEAAEDHQSTLKRVMSVTLNVQFRHLASVGYTVSMLSYGGIVKTGIMDSERDLPQSTYFAFPNNSRMAFIDLDSEEEVDKKNSRKNKVEAAFAIKLAIGYIEQGLAPEDLVLMTGYTAQKGYMSTLLKTQTSEINASNTWKSQEVINRLQRVKVFSVNVYQGKESVLVIMSMTSSSGPGFMKDRRRLNVAISRCTHATIILGKAQGIVSKDNDLTMRQLLQLISDSGCLMRRTTRGAENEKYDRLILTHGQSYDQIMKGGLPLRKATDKDIEWFDDNQRIGPSAEDKERNDGNTSK